MSRRAPCDRCLAIEALHHEIAGRSASRSGCPMSGSPREFGRLSAGTEGAPVHRRRLRQDLDGDGSVEPRVPRAEVGNRLSGCGDPVERRRSYLTSTLPDAR